MRGDLNAGLNILGIKQDQKLPTEVDIVAFYGAPTAVNYINMPTDPLQHHNIINGPKMGKRAVDVDEKEINPCEKPDYFAVDPS